MERTMETQIAELELDILTRTETVARAVARYEHAAKILPMPLTELQAHIARQQVLLENSRDVLLELLEVQKHGVGSYRQAMEELTEDGYGIPTQEAHDYLMARGYRVDS